jgi:hypothetical protein
MTLQYFWAAVAILATAAVILFLKKRIKKKKVFSEMLQRFSHLGTVHKMNFTSQEILSHGVLGFDAQKSKLLLLQVSQHDVLTPFFVNLSYIKKCFVKRNYSTSHDKYLLTIEPKKEIDSITLCFETGFGELPAEILFYKAGIDQVNELTNLENRAVDWELMINKMIVPEERERNKI